MADKDLILAIDQGTTSSRAILFDSDGRATKSAQREFRQIYPQSGWVEHDPEEIWNTVLEVCRSALAQSGAGAARIAAIGIANQRETTVVWNRKTGAPVHNAIVWQDRRTSDFCRALKAEGRESEFQARTGLLLDPYFSGTKLRWILDNVDGARAAAEGGELAFGTVDCFLIWRLTGGRTHATDATNAARTLMFDIHEQDWSDGLLNALGVPRSMLPAVLDCSARFGETDPDLLGAAIPVLGVAGDQQAATFGQACFQPGMAKNTYGTGCFLLLNTGGQAVASNNKLLATPVYRLSGQTAYGIEGSVFAAGAAVQWLRDGLRIVASAGETEALAGQSSNAGVYMVPAFTGLGAPHWDPDARGALFGLTRDTGPADLARAALEAACLQSRDLLDAMRADGAGELQALRVDGGMAVNDWAMQRQADLLGIPVERPQVAETTALGAAYLAGLRAGIWSTLDEVAAQWRCERRFEPTMSADERESLHVGWKDAVARTRGAVGG